MKKVETKDEVREVVRDVRCSGGSIGVVPTMGYLHEGHMSLVRRAREETSFVILTIFVNPTQFGPGEDLERYPRDLERDLEKARKAGVDLVFAPSEEEMYGPDHATWIEVEGLTEGLCGARRPGHFRGVTTVVGKLFNICRPDVAYFGQKDGQQAFVVERMLQIWIRVSGSSSVLLCADRMDWQLAVPSQYPPGNSWTHRIHRLGPVAVSYTHLRAHETKANLVCRLLL